MKIELFNIEDGTLEFLLYENKSLLGYDYKHPLMMLFLPGKWENGELNFLWSEATFTPSLPENEIHHYVESTMIELDFDTYIKPAARKLIQEKVDRLEVGEDIYGILHRKYIHDCRDDDIDITQDPNDEYLYSIYFP